MNLLILGGTTEATALARALAGDARFSATLSLAGVTRRPAAQPIPIRVGGFGGVAGLAHYLRQTRIGALVDATHPFATQMTANAIATARQTRTPLLVVLRPAWQPTAGDRWTDGGQHGTRAAAMLGAVPRRVLLTIGRKDLAPFARGALAPLCAALGRPAARRGIAAARNGHRRAWPVRVGRRGTPAARRTHRRGCHQEFGRQRDGGKAHRCPQPGTAGSDAGAARAATDRHCWQRRRGAGVAGAASRRRRRAANRATHDHPGARSDELPPNR